MVPNLVKSVNHDQQNRRHASKIEASASAINNSKIRAKTGWRNSNGQCDLYKRVHGIKGLEHMALNKHEKQ